MLDIKNSDKIVIVGRKKIKIGEYEFFEEDLQANPFFLPVLLIALDPTEKQKTAMDAVGVSITDINGKKVYPQDEKK